MNPYLDRLKNADFVWDAITAQLTGKTVRSRTNFVNFDCPMCVLRGESRDTKKRCGITQHLEGGAEGVGISCFNCGFRSIYTLGQRLSGSFRSFLSQIGMSEIEIQKLNHTASVAARLYADSSTTTTTAPAANRFKVNFSPVSLPKDSYPISLWLDNGGDDPDLISVADYVASRGEVVASRAFWSPEPKWRHRALFPCYFRGDVVGYTGRLVTGNVSDDEPKYRNIVPANYLSNCDSMNDPERKYILMPEGFLDSEVIDGISPMGAKLNKNQIAWINETGKTVIVIPDRDKSGQRLIDFALEQNWHVAFPRLTLGGNNWWEEDCKDCAEAVKRYGRLYTLKSIIETSTARRLEIEVRRKWLY